MKVDSTVKYVSIIIVDLIQGIVLVENPVADHEGTESGTGHTTEIKAVEDSTWIANQAGK